MFPLLPRPQADRIARVGCWLWVVAIAGFLVVARSAEGPDPRSLVVPELPAWVHPPLSVDPAASRVDPTATSPSTATRMHIVETQTDVAQAEEFRHYAYRIETEAGLQHSGQVSVDFAPAYQTLRWHFIRIWREGKTREVLDPALIQVLRQEENAERFLYHGRMTALLLLHDVRVGDVVEFAYTLTGQNPVFGGVFSTWLTGSSAIPIDRLYHRINGASDSRLQITTLGDFKPVHHENEVDGHTEHTWTAEHLPAVSALNDVPANECQFAYAQVTEYIGWNDVRTWARALFAAHLAPTPEVMARVQSLLVDCKTTEEKADVLLRFVQDDVRYLGLHLNESTHRPAAPLDVIDRRFGDCKDKSLLLTALLRGIGLEADVALVSSTWRDGVITLQPSPLSFDHAIVRVRIPAEKAETPSLKIRASDSFVWLDPTLTLQGGDFERHHVPAYGHALVLDDTNEGLVAVTSPRAADAVTVVREVYTISDYTSPVNLKINTTYQGATADSYRYFRRVADSARYTQQMTGFLARFYPKIKALGPIEWTDDRKRNVLTSRLVFEIDEFWATDAAKQYRTIEFYPWALSDQLTRPETVERTFSFALPHPVSFSQHTAIFLPKEWPDSTDSREISDDTFAYALDIQSKGRRTDLRYDWRTLADSVPAGRVGEWNKKMNEVRATFGYVLNQNIRLAEAVQKKGIVWSVVASATLGVLAGLIVGVVLYRWQPAPRPRPANSRHLEGLGGWLVLLGIGVVFRPLAQLLASKDIFNLIGNHVGWITLTDPESGGYVSGYASLVWSEAFSQGLFFAWSMVMIFQFFRRKPSLPRSLSALLLIAIVWEIVDYLFLVRLFPQEPAATGPKIITHVLFTILWVGYLHRSRRVRMTFRSRSATPKVATPQLADSSTGS